MVALRGCSSGRSQALVNPGAGKDAFRGSQATAGPPKPAPGSEGPSERQAEALRHTAHSRPQDMAPASDNPQVQVSGCGTLSEFLANSSKDKEPLSAAPQIQRNSPRSPSKDGVPTTSCRHLPAYSHSALKGAGAKCSVLLGTREAGRGLLVTGPGKAASDANGFLFSAVGLTPKPKGAAHSPGPVGRN